MILGGKTFGGGSRTWSATSIVAGGRGSCGARCLSRSRLESAATSGGCCDDHHPELRFRAVPQPAAQRERAGEPVSVLARPLCQGLLGREHHDRDAAGLARGRCVLPGGRESDGRGGRKGWQLRTLVR